MNTDEIIQEQRALLRNNIVLDIFLPKGKEFLEPIRLILNYAIEGYMLRPLDKDESNIIYDNMFSMQDRYNRRRLQLDSKHVDKYFEFWYDVGINSCNKVIAYLELDENVLCRIFELCSCPTLLTGVSNSYGYNSMMKKVKGKPEIIGVFIDTNKGTLSFDACLDTKLNLYDMLFKI